MGLTKEEAYRILGLNKGASHYVIRAHYCKLANRYHPEKSILRREVAQQKFQKVVEAYVRLQIDPDDCDQLKMKMILTELYAINEDILTGEYSFSEDSDSDRESNCTELASSYSSGGSSSSSFASQRGPYADVLQDFMLRSYMSGGRKTKPSVNIGTEKKRQASEREFALATKHADELLMGEEQERKKEEKRKQKNKKKKEAKKKKKDQVTPSAIEIKRSLSSPDLNEDSSENEEKEEDEMNELCEEHEGDLEIHSVLSEIGNGFDTSSAFFSRVTSKLTDTKSKQHTSAEPQQEHVQPLGKKKNFSSSTPTKNISSSSIEYSTTDSENINNKVTNNSWRSSSSSSCSIDDTLKEEEGEGKVTNGHMIKDKTTKEEQKTKSSSSVKGITHRVYKGGRKSQYVPYGHQFPPNLPPRLAKLQQNSFTKSDHKFPSPPVVRKRIDKQMAKQQDDIGESYESKDTKFLHDEREITDTTTVVRKKTDQYSPEAILKNGDSKDLDQSRKMAVLGNRAAKEGRFEDAVLHFTKAIQHYSGDLRYFGNRSFCYEYMKEYELALQDAVKALKIDSQWPKGHFRKAKAFVGLKMYEEAEESFKKAIEYDPNYKDAKEELTKTKIKRITLLGYEESLVNETLVQCDDNVQETIEYLKKTSGGDDGMGVVSCSGCDHDADTEGDKTDHVTITNNKREKAKNSCSLWIGNVNPATVTEGMLYDKFKKCGTVKAVQILSNSFCAFVEYSKPSEVNTALKELQNCNIGECDLVLRIPDNLLYGKKQKVPSSGTVKKTGPVNGDECYFWRTTGCAFGSKCRHRHITSHKGIDTDKLFKTVSK